MAEGTNNAGDFLKVLNTAGTYFQALEKRVQCIEEKIARLEAGTGGDNGSCGDAVSAPVYDAPAVSSIERQEPQYSGQNTVEAKKECLYFANGAAGVFLKTTASPEFLDRISLYCFEKINENEAFVSVVDKHSVVRKFSSNPDALESFCEQLNQCGERDNGVETIERGKAVLEGDKWRITNKVKIRYYCIS
ncbi:MAG: hypothetical protein FWC23_01135 [Chitinispirillia bacterium]|nr:hypothetical protein [Chitinispirillia bacterium]MCL2267780.1 hypothetical protein [Chitinispirillia bacterium]